MDHEKEFLTCELFNCCSNWQNEPFLLLLCFIVQRCWWQKHKKLHWFYMSAYLHENCSSQKTSVSWYWAPDWQTAAAAIATARRWQQDRSGGKGRGPAIRKCRPTSMSLWKPLLTGDETLPDQRLWFKKRLHPALAGRTGYLFIPQYIRYIFGWRLEAKCTATLKHFHSFRLF